MVSAQWYRSSRLRCWNAAVAASNTTPFNRTYWPPAPKGSSADRRRRPGRAHRCSSVRGRRGWSLDDHRGDHAEHAVGTLDVVEDVAVPDPRADGVGVEEDGVPLAGGDEDGVGGVRLVERFAVLGVHDLLEAVEVHRVHLEAFVEVGDLDPVALVDDVRLGRGEALAVEREA